MHTYGAHLLCLTTLFALCGCESCTPPLHLTPFIDAGNITAALELSEVKDLHGTIPKSYAGFITTDRKAKNHLFFWFFPSLNDTNAPLMVWLNGGPTVSSMFGLFYENGPLRTRTDNGRVTYERRPNSWADPFSMLYIDNPVGVGFSYSETGSFKTTQDEYSEELYLFIEQFYLMFPVYFSRELYIGGQSYAGKYVPAIAHRIHTRILEGKSQIPLTGIYLGGPYFDPLVQSFEFCEFYYSMGMVSHSRLEKCKKGVSNLEATVQSGITDDLTYSEIFRVIFPTFSHVTTSGSRENYVSTRRPGHSIVEELLETQEMKVKLHACNRVFRVGNSELMDKFREDLLVSTKSKLAVLMDRYKVLLYTGDYDGLITSPMVEASLMTTPWERQEEYNNSVRSTWRLDDDLRGFYTNVGTFCRVVIHQAGHQIPHDQPESTLDMMIHFVRHGCIRENV